jgi:hypothetical protein
MRDVAKQWQNFVSNSHSLVTVIFVHRVSEWLQIKFLAQCPRLLSSQPEQRMSVATHTCETSRTRTTQQVDQYGFCLVIGGMPCQHVIGQYRESCNAGPGLEIRTFCNVDGS